MKPLKKLHEEQKKLPKVHAEVERELKKIPGVIAVDIGFKETTDKITDTISFIVYVEEKVKESDLSPEHVIPKEIHGVQTDVKKIASASFSSTTLPDTEKHRPIMGGIQIGNGIKSSTGSYSRGTLGCLAKLNSDNSVVALGNHHVMFGNGAHGETIGNNDGSKMGQPEYWESCYCCDCDKIGNLIGGFRDGTVDCAISTVDDDIERVNEIEEIGTIAGMAPVQNIGGIDTSVLIGDPVKKRGKTSGLKNGTVQSINYSINISGTLFTGQIHVTPDNPAEKFQDFGDSGSVLVNASNQVVGLLFSAPYKPGTTDFDGSGVANKIHEVTSKLNISIQSGAIPAGGGPTSSIKKNTTFNLLDNPEAAKEDAIEMIKKIEYKLNSSQYGKTLIKLFYKHRSEIRDLINECRPVTVIWHRYEGPAFIVSVYRSLVNPQTRILTQINRITFDSLLENMKAILIKHGSIQLIQDIKAHSETLTDCLRNSISIEGFADNIINEFKEA
ncbi:MAG: hypothetical protein GY855_06805 [candidate division Zixibacteria bacterium]|nr:hypothetical protein [candidate division Zixibacteria bacterium]